MGTVAVDQINSLGALIRNADVTLSEPEKNACLLSALPGARVEKFAGVRVVRFGKQIIFKAQVTHLGYPWPEFKKRIQIPKTWLEGHRQAIDEGLRPRFVGIYHYGGVTIFVDFDPATYVKRKANNSAAHVATNDLFQAQTLGEFARTDANGNRLTSVRADHFADYLTSGFKQADTRIDIFTEFNREFLVGEDIEVLGAVNEMHSAAWPDRFQSEWAGFYVEYRLDRFLRSNHLTDRLEFQKAKSAGAFDYDLVFKSGDALEHYGDLKASDLASADSPGNDAEDIKRCVEQYGRFWYVVYEHETRHARKNGDIATIAWNQLRRELGHKPAKGYNELSYAKKLKESVRFVKMTILEVNPANFNVVLSEFAQGHQPNGAPRALKVMIKKKNIDNFLIMTEDIRA